MNNSLRITALPRMVRSSAEAYECLVHPPLTKKSCAGLAVMSVDNEARFAYALMQGDKRRYPRLLAQRASRGHPDAYTLPVPPRPEVDAIGTGKAEHLKTARISEGHSTGWPVWADDRKVSSSKRTLRCATEQRTLRMPVYASLVRMRFLSKLKRLTTIAPRSCYAQPRSVRDLQPDPTP